MFNFGLVRDKIFSFYLISCLQFNRP